MKKKQNEKGLKIERNTTSNSSSNNCVTFVWNVKSQSYETYTMDVGKIQVLLTSN